MIQNEINARIDAFVKDLEALVAREALAAVSAALGTPLARPALALGRPALVRAVARAAASPVRAASPRRGRAARPRAKAAGKQAPKSGDGTRIDSAVVEYVKANPGSGVEQMVKALKVPTIQLKARVAGLVAAKSIRKTGKTRGTRYFPV